MTKDLTASVAGYNVSASEAAYRVADNPILAIADIGCLEHDVLLGDFSSSSLTTYKVGDAFVDFRYKIGTPFKSSETVGLALHCVGYGKVQKASVGRSAILLKNRDEKSAP